MRFVVRLTHDPDNCWAREENEATARNWIADMENKADRHDVNLQCAYVTPSEHTFFIVVEGESFEDVSGFLDGPLLTDHEGDISPVIPLKELPPAIFDE